MKRNGLVFVPREPPKRVILYPTQDSTSQQPNGFSTRPKTALIINNRSEALQQSNNTIHISRQQPLSSPPNSTSKLPEKSDNNETVPNSSGQPTSLNAGQKLQNPYYANPFFRPKLVTNQRPTTTTNTNLLHPPPSRDSSTITIQTSTSVSTATTNRGRQSVLFKPQNLLVSSNGRIQETEATANTSSTQDDNRRWAHTVASALIARRAVSDDRTNGTFKSSETNISNSTNNDALKQKVTSATDIVISLMDTWRAPINPGGSSAMNIFTRVGGIKDDSAITGHSSTASEQLPNTPPFLTVGATLTASNNNQNWKKALVANFQKNSRNIPTAKLFNSKQTIVPLQPSTSINTDSTINQQQKPERTMILNGLNNERTFQVNENTPTIPSLIRKSTESLRLTKQDINNNNNIERTNSLQIQSATYSNPITTTATTNKTEEIAKPIEVLDQENVPHMPISIPSALIIAKPPANVEQQRAIITRVMIRRDFVKSTELKPPMPIAGNFRSLIPPQSAKPGGLSTNNIIQVATITENTNGIISTSNSDRIYPFQQQQQQSIPLSQKSLLSFTSNNLITKESLKIENNQQQLNGITNDGLTSSSLMKMQQSQTGTNNSGTFRSSSLSAANAELKRKKEEINKTKKRAISASAISNDG